MKLQLTLALLFVEALAASAMPGRPHQEPPAEKPDGQEKDKFDKRQSGGEVAASSVDAASEQEQSFWDKLVNKANNIVPDSVKDRFDSWNKQMTKQTGDKNWFDDYTAAAKAKWDEWVGGGKHKRRT